MLRRCFEMTRPYGKRVDIPSAALAKLRGVILDRAKLARILGAGVPSGATISGVTHDSRRVEPGFAFVAIPGFKRDGAEFAPEALRRGAALIVAERGIPELPDAPTVVVPDARGALAALSCGVHDDPSRSMQVYGVTGTNGKTTTAYALNGILVRAFGERACGLITTVETISAGARAPAVRTTPEATDVQATLAGMRDAGVSHVVMEVSSHGVALERVTGTRFSGALFTNLTRDHLDLHGSMEDYFAAKRELFHWTKGPKLANAEDPWGRRLAAEIEGVKTFGGTTDADYRVSDVLTTRGGTRFSLIHAGDELVVESPLLGPYNVLNVAGAMALALEIGVERNGVADAVRRMAQVPGRFERIGGRRARVRGRGRLRPHRRGPRGRARGGARGGRGRGWGRRPSAVGACDLRLRGRWGAGSRQTAGDGTGGIQARRLQRRNHG